MKPLIVHRQGDIFLGRDGLTVENLPKEFQKNFPELSPKYVDSVSLLAGVAAWRVLNGSKDPLANETSDDFAVIVGSAFGAIDSTVDFDSQALLKGPNAVNPMDFPNTVANAAGSRIGIWLQLKGPNVTLTNGGTSLIDAIGFAWEAFNSGLFQRCIVGAVEKIPNFLKPLAAPALDPVEWREGACLFLGSGVENGDFLFKVEDYFAVQLKPDFSLPKGFLNRFERLFDGVEWLGVPGKTPLEAKFPANLVRYSPNPSVMELGLSGFKALEFFLSGSQLCGIIAAFSKPERKFSFIKISKKGSRQNADVRN